MGNRLNTRRGFKTPLAVQAAVAVERANRKEAARHKAHLIAAAPDLLAACQAAKEWTVYGASAPIVMQSEQREYIAQLLEAAIAKAEGRA